MRVSILCAALAMVVATGCGPETEQLLPSGTGTVVGSAFGGTDFSYAATEVRVLADPREDGSVTLNLTICERACEPFGLGVEDDTRAVTASIIATPAELAAGGRYVYGTTLDGFAVFRPRTTDGIEIQRRTLVDQMITGSEITLQPFVYQAGSTVRGAFSILLQSNGALTGQFEAPLVVLGEEIPAQ